MKAGLARPYRNSGVAYIPKRRHPEMDFHIRVCTYLRRNYPHVVFHSDFAANADLSENQKKVNKSLQSNYKFIDLTIFAASRGYCGLALELKKDGTIIVLKTGPNKGKLTTNEHIRKQAVTLRKLRDAGWYSNFAVGYEQTIKIIDWYFENEQQSLF